MGAPITTQRAHAVVPPAVTAAKKPPRIELQANFAEMSNRNHLSLVGAKNNVSKMTFTVQVLNNDTLIKRHYVALEKLELTHRGKIVQAAIIREIGSEEQLKNPSSISNLAYILCEGEVEKLILTEEEKAIFKDVRLFFALKDGVRVPFSQRDPNKDVVGLRIGPTSDQTITTIFKQAVQIFNETVRPVVK